MNTPARLLAFGGALVLAFGASFAVSGLVVPDDVVAGWTETAAPESHGDGEQPTSVPIEGISMSAAGYTIAPITAPTQAGESGELQFQILGPDLQPVTEYQTAHDKDLHLIIVRMDGSQFAHVHPVLDATGTWTLPWTWGAAGTYRVYADFTTNDGTAVTLSRTFDVAGEVVDAAPAGPVTSVTVGDTLISLAGGMVAGESSDLTFTVTSDGEPVTTIEPYLGAFGHLVVLRQGDLAYLHAHAHGDAPAAGDTSGPTIVFSATAPTVGRYLLYLDVQIDGEVITAPLVIDVTAQSDASVTENDTHDDH